MAVAVAAAVVAAAAGVLCPPKAPSSSFFFSSASPTFNTSFKNYVDTPNHRVNIGNVVMVLPYIQLLNGETYQKQEK